MRDFFGPRCPGLMNSFQKKSMPQIHKRPHYAKTNAVTIEGTDFTHD